MIRALRGGIAQRTGNGAGALFAGRCGSLSRDEYMAGVQRTQEYIAAGDVYQLVLSVALLRAATTLDPFEAYRALRLINPSPYMYYCELGDVTVVGSSPEALVKLNARAARELRPIAGTRPRGRRPGARRRARSGAARRSEGKRRARDAGGSGAQRSRARRAARAACTWIRTARSSATAT